MAKLPTCQALPIQQRSSDAFVDIRAISEPLPSTPTSRPCLLEPKCSLPICPRLFERDHLSSTSNTLIRARTLIVHLPHVYPSAITRLPPPSSQFEHEHSLMSIRAQSLISYFKHVISSPNARRPPPPCLFKCNHSFSISTILNARFPSRPCLFEFGRLSPASTISN